MSQIDERIRLLMLKREIEKNIKHLLKEIEEIRNNPERKSEFRIKIQQLMYWRRQRNRIGVSKRRNFSNL